MTEKKVDLEQVQKSLAALKESVSKGHNSRGTATTEVPAMAGEGGSTQVHHTASNSDPGTWAGTGQRPAGADDAIDENGTDYKGGAEVVKSILAKVQKGQALTGAERLVLSMMAKGSYPGDDDKEDVDKAADMDELDMDKGMDEEEDEDEMDKSLAARASSNASLSKGFEVSDFLKDLVTEISKSLEANKQAVCRYVDRRLAENAAVDGEFRKSLVGAVSSIGDVSVATNERIAQLEGAPARAPRSVSALQQVQALEKGGFNGGENLSKSQINDILVDAVIHKGLNPQVQLRFDATGELTDQARAVVSKAAAERR